MKLVSTVALAAFLTATGTTEAFGPAQPLHATSSFAGRLSSVPITNSGNGSFGLIMRIGQQSMRRKQRLLDIIDTNPSKEMVQDVLLSQETSEMIQECHWKLRKALIRKIKHQAFRYEIAVDPNFGVPPTQDKREDFEKIEGARRKAARQAALKEAMEQTQSRKEERMKKRAESKARSQEFAEKLKAEKAARAPKPDPEPVPELEPVLEPVAEITKAELEITETEPEFVADQVAETLEPNQESGPLSEQVDPSLKPELEAAEQYSEPLPGSVAETAQPEPEVSVPELEPVPESVAEAVEAEQEGAEKASEPVFAETSELKPEIAEPDEELVQGDVAKAVESELQFAEQEHEPSITVIPEPEPKVPEPGPESALAGVEQTVEADLVVEQEPESEVAKPNPKPLVAAVPAAAASEPVADTPAPASAAPGKAVTPKTIKELRDATGAGMMDCKKALLESDGDLEAAAEYLRKKGLAKADKKASRVAAEGKIAIAIEHGKAVMVEVNCETDFVGKDSTFLEFSDKVARTALNVEGDSVESLMSQEVDGETLEATRQALVAKIGENIQVRRMSTRGGSGNTVVGGYVHMNSIGVLVELEGGNEELCTNIAMHVTAMNPPYATANDVPAEVLEKEKQILSAQALESGKPPEIVKKMVEGRIRKYLEDICLVSQPYVKDGDKTVGKLLEENGAKIVGFSRLVVGEGIEKKQDDFAAEVAKMAGVKADSASTEAPLAEPEPEPLKAESKEEATIKASKPAGGAVTPKTIKELREATGAGMMDCKKALLETNGDQEAAVEYLRKKGLAKADKKASRVAAEGKIAIAATGNKAVMVEVNCETDFVAKDDNFVGFCDKVAGVAVDVSGDNVEELMAMEVGGESLEAARQTMVAKIGENIQVRRMASRGREGSTVGAYVHMNRLGVLVEIDGGSEELCVDIAMHIAAMNPPYATADEVPADVLEKEKQILSAQALESGKPREIVEKMVEGRIRKYLEDICLVSQIYVKDGGKTVGKLLEENGAKMIGFTRLAVGEGIEKKTDDFAAEVAKMVGKEPAPV